MRILVVGAGATEPRDRLVHGKIELHVDATGTVRVRAQTVRP
jgi:hypothetical protein